MHTYMVQRGDTLWKIAQRYGTTAAALAELNSLPNPDLIYEGQVLRVPSSASDSGATGQNNGPGVGSAVRAGQRYRVDSDVGIKVRAAPALTAAEKGRLPSGAIVLASGEPPHAQDGYTWLSIHAESYGLQGFVAMEFLAPTKSGRWPDVFSAAQLYELVRLHGAEPFLDSVMVAAALLESSANTRAIGDGGHAAGLWQLNDGGAGRGMSIADRCDPDIACDQMLPEFRSAYAARLRTGVTGEELAVQTYLHAERPADWDAAGAGYRKKWQTL